MPESLDPALVDRLLGEEECEWVEFKHNWFDPAGVGKYVSALGNAARLAGTNAGYLVWGVSDSGEVVGTNVDLSGTVGNQPFEFWLRQRISPDQHQVRFFEGACRGHRVVLLSTEAPTAVPVRFEKRGYIRVGSATPALETRPDLEKRLIDALAESSAEAHWVMDGLRTEEVYELLDLDGAVTLLQLDSVEPGSTLSELEKLGLLATVGGDQWSVATSAALLFAHRLADFGHIIERKAPRVIFYDGDSRVQGRSEQTGIRGYATGFEGLIDFVEARLPRNEHLRGVMRREQPVFPLDALRELIGNALIHQDLGVRGAGPIVEVFESRLEVSNPGLPLVPVDRLIDEAPRSRNERIARLMRQIGYCDERGSGIDKVVSFAEIFQLPPPHFDPKSQSFTATLYAPRAYTDMTATERIRASYQHACLRWVTGGQTMTNATLRTRFGLLDGRAAQISRLLKDALEQGVIREADPKSKSRAHAAYVPYWA